MKIEQIEKLVEHMKILKPASIKEEPTGDVREVTIYTTEGTRIEERPVMRQTYVEPVTKVETVLTKFWTIKDGEETHEFKSRADAVEFLKGVKK